MSDKATLRQQFLGQRPDKLQRQELSDRLCQHLWAFLDCHVQPGQLLLTYWPYQQEPDLSNLLRTRQYQWGLPRCLPDRQLAWHFWQWGDPLVANVYGIEEPLATAPTIDPSQVSLFIVPAVAIDYQGYRLGYGGGYFDRLLSCREWQQIATIGVVFNVAYVPHLPVDDWDRPLHYVCTESGVQTTSWDNSCTQAPK